MKKPSVQLRIAPLWDPSPAELLRRARERDDAVRRLREDREAEDWRGASVARYATAGILRRYIRFLNRS